MKPRHITLAILLAVFFAVAAAANAQTLRSLAYNTTNFTVAGWTNTNALTFTNPIVASAGSVIGGVTLGPDGETYGSTFEASALLAIDSVQLRKSTNGGLLLNTSIVWNNTTNADTTRTNLFGHGGITTNISVLVPGGGTNTLRFTNGLLFSNSVP